MKRKVAIQSGSIRVNKSSEGETIETTVDRMLYGNEPFEEGVERIYTEASEGVKAEYNHRTDKYVEMLKMSEESNKSLSVKNIREKIKKDAEEEEKNKEKSDGAESIQGKSENDTK